MPYGALVPPGIRSTNPPPGTATVREFGIGTDRSDHDQLGKLALAGLLDQLDPHDRILVKELAGMILIGADAAHCRPPDAGPWWDDLLEQAMNGVPIPRSYLALRGMGILPGTRAPAIRPPRTPRNPAPPVTTTPCASQKPIASAPSQARPRYPLCRPVTQHLHIGIHHQPHQFLERGAGFPSQNRVRLGSVADEDIHLGGTEIMFVDLNVVFASPIPRTGMLPGRIPSPNVSCRWR